MIFSKKAIWTGILLIAIIAVGAVWWNIVMSYSTVTFKFDTATGKASISSTETGRQTIADGQSVKIKKGTYTLSTFGNNISTKNKSITINESSQTVVVSFTYTKEYLAMLYKKEEEAITTALLKKYPSIRKHYKITGGALYQKGEYFGAKLIHRNQSSDNRDSLRVLMKKQSDAWIILSNPPVPVLSAPNFPEVSVDTLRAINLTK